MSLSKINSIQNKFPHFAAKLLSARCNTYIARGSLAANEWPTTKAELLEMIQGSEAKFSAFGVLDGDGSEITWEDETYELDHSTVKTSVKLTGKYANMTVNADMLGFIDEIGSDIYTLLNIPVDSDDLYYALNGVTITTNGSIGIVKNGPSKIDFTATKKANKLGNVLVFREISE
jgi:hypothetical protein